MSNSCSHMDYSPPGSSVHGILQARVLEWIAISFSRESSWSRDRTCVSCIDRQVFTTEPPVNRGYIPRLKSLRWCCSHLPHRCFRSVSGFSVFPGASRGSDRRAPRERRDRCLTGCTVLPSCFLSQAQYDFLLKACQGSYLLAKSTLHIVSGERENTIHLIPGFLRNDSAQGSFWCGAILSACEGLLLTEGGLRGAMVVLGVCHWGSVNLLLVPLLGPSAL